MSEASRIIAQATVYVDRGWAVIPLHEGRILPIEREWPTRLCRSRTEVEAIWSLYPGANIGIVTGRASGIWVLDIDPDNGGSLALA
ncbi:MAG: bifunctional DNA primase/polymerase, partial [Sphingomonadales bacterium]